QAEDGIRDFHVTGVQTCALPISHPRSEATSVRSVRRPALETTPAVALPLRYSSTSGASFESRMSCPDCCICSYVLSSNCTSTPGCSSSKMSIAVFQAADSAESSFSHHQTLRVWPSSAAPVLPPPPPSSEQAPRASARTSEPAASTAVRVRIPL